jgi:hypothetical protein
MVKVPQKIIREKPNPSRFASQFQTLRKWARLVEAIDKTVTSFASASLSAR